MNDLEKYFSDIDDLTGFNPNVFKDANDAVMELLADDNRNDPTAWMAYAGTTIKQAWSALPDEVRNQMMDAIDGVIDLAVSGAKSISSALGAAALAANAAPVVGQILSLVIVVVRTVVQTKSSLAESHKGISKSHKAARMSVTFESYSDPRDWVFKSMKLENYTQYVESRKQGNWSRQPCFRRAGLGTDKMFASKSGAADVGKCGHKGGVRMRCPGRRKFGYEDCKRYYKNKKKNPPSYCERHLGISSLFYPYWSPAYPAEPIPNAFLGTDSDPNGILMGQQTMLLTDPYSNLRVVGKDLLKMVDRFVTVWRKQMNEFAVDGKKALLRIDRDGNAPGTSKSDRLTIDDQMNPDYTGNPNLKNRFYFDEDGRILPYAGMDADVNEWGIRTVGGSDHGADGGALGVTVGAYNAVITNTMSFFTARSNMLRNGARMSGLLDYKSISDLDPEVRDAVQYAADKGTMIPMPVKMLAKPMKAVMVGSSGSGSTPIKVATLTSSVKRPPRFSLASTSIDEGPSGKKKKKKSSSKLPLLLGAAAIGFVVMKKK